MAFTKTPLQDTYQTKIVPLMVPLDARSSDGSKSSQAMNVVFEVVSNPTGGDYLQIQKREGLEVYRTITDPQSDEVLLGAYMWDIYADFAVAVTNYGIYYWNLLDNGSQTFISFPSSADVDVGFTEFVYDDNTCDLIIVIGNTFGTLTVGGVWTPVSDPDAPNSDLKPFPVFLDGYLFLAAKNTIYNSDLNDPLSWSASNFITVEAYPGFVDVLLRSGAYIVALCDRSVQYFYDAANPTGTPLAVVQGASKAISHLGGFAKQQDTFFFIGAGRAGNIEVYKGEGLKINPLPSAPISRWLQLLREDTPERRNIHGTILGLQGTNIYHIYNPRSSISYGYQINSNSWSRFAIGSSTRAEIVYAQNSRANISSGAIEYGDYRTFITLPGRNSIYYFNTEAYRDIGENFSVEFTTRPLDFETYRRKFASRMLIHSDMTSTSSNMYVSWSDNDYGVFSNPRAIDLSSPARSLYQLGVFRYRVLKVTYSDNFPMRWSVVELDYDQGQA